MNANCIDRSAGAPRFARPALLVATSAILIAALCAGCGKGGGPVAGKDPIKKVVKVESNVGALRAWAENNTRASVLVHIDPSDDMANFPASRMKDMENAAGHLRRRNVKALDEIGALIEPGGTVSLGYMAGLYKRVIWVIPTIRPVGEDPVEVYKNFLITQRRYPAEAVADFKAEGKFITGTIAGVPLTITRLADLALAEGENAIVDIDLSYFPAMRIAGRSYYRQGTKSLLEFLRELGTRNVKAKIVTVNLSNLNNQVPMDLRYYGDVIREGLAKPGDLVPPGPEKWRSMIRAEDSLGAKRFASAAAMYDDIIRTTKDDAGLYFSLAVARGFENKGPECRAALLEAYRLDGEYLKGFFQLARVLADAGMLDAGFEILDTPDLAKIIAPVELDYQRGLFLYTAHKPFDAAAYLSRVAQQRPKDFGLYTILFRAHREAGNDQGQISALQRLVDIDNGRVRREMPWVYADLGQLYDRSNFWGNASEMYKQYMQVHPDDSLSKVFGKRIDGWKAQKMLKQ
jgi:tetratricopeptide (TPR) repeat protein